MNKAFLIFLFLLTCVYATPGTADNYAIELKNGSVFITESYWEEGNRINFLLLGGVAGLDKDHIQSITKTVLKVEKPHIGSETPTAGPDNYSNNNAQPENTTDQPPSEINSKEDNYISITQKNHFLNTRDMIVEQMKTTRRNIQEAKKQGIKAKQKEFEKEFISLNKDLKILFDEVIEANGGTPPKWWPLMWAKDMGL